MITEVIFLLRNPIYVNDYKLQPFKPLVNQMTLFYIFTFSFHKIHFNM